MPAYMSTVESPAAAQRGGVPLANGHLHGADAMRVALAGVWRLAAWMRSDWRFLGPLLLVNVVGMAYGWYYYTAPGVAQIQLDDVWCEEARSHCTPWYAWPLVADSPNALLVFAVAVLLGKLGRRSPVLDSLAFALNVYVGLWTTVLFLGFPSRMGTFDWGSTNSLLFVTHMGMPLQALLLVPAIRRDAWRWAPTALFLLFLAAYVYVDYGAPLWHPAPFLHPRDGLLHQLSPVLMLAVAMMWVLLAAPWSKMAERPVPKV